jgi:hypothetical protein
MPATVNAAIVMPVQCEQGVLFACQYCLNTRAMVLPLLLAGWLAAG